MTQAKRWDLKGAGARGVRASYQASIGHNQNHVDAGQRSIAPHNEAINLVLKKFDASSITFNSGVSKKRVFLQTLVLHRHKVTAEQPSTNKELTFSRLLYFDHLAMLPLLLTSAMVM